MKTKKGKRLTIYLYDNIYDRLNEVQGKYDVSLSKVINVLLYHTFKQFKQNENEIENLIKQAAIRF
jgi:hypothetical protein